MAESSGVPGRIGAENSVPMFSCSQGFVVAFLLALALLGVLGRSWASWFLSFHCFRFILCPSRRVGANDANFKKF